MVNSWKEAKGTAAHATTYTLDRKIFKDLEEVLIYGVRHAYASVNSLRLLLGADTVFYEGDVTSFFPLPPSENYHTNIPHHSNETSFATFPKQMIFEMFRSIPLRFADQRPITFHRRIRRFNEKVLYAYVIILKISL